MRVAAVLLMLPLVACATPSPSPQVPMYAYWAPARYKAELAARAAAARAAPPITVTGYVPDLIDGSYQGTAYLTSAPNLDVHHYWHHPNVSDQTCPRTNYGIVEIDQDLLTYAYSPSLVFAAPVAQDGTLHQVVDGASLDGRVRHGHLTFNITTPICTTRFFGNFKLNHSY